MSERSELHHLVDDLSPDAVQALLTLLGGARERMTREQALAKIDDLWGPLPDDAVAWARGVCGTNQAKAS